MNIEHSWADAPVTGHMWEYLLYDEVFKIGFDKFPNVIYSVLFMFIFVNLMCSYDEKGHSRGSARFEELPDPIRLKFEFNSKVKFSFFLSIYNKS